jgi:NADPH:quinone reductase-like Zn-dependent oxidoreductase
MPKVAQIHAFGGPENIKIDDLPIPEPADNEVLIKVAACTLNRADEMRYRNSDPNVKEPPSLPAAFGSECAGVVEAVGAEVQQFKVGDAVNTCPWLAPGYGTTAEYVATPEFCVSHYPDHLSTLEASAVWMQYLTSWGALFAYGGLTANDTVLVTSGSSSTGIAAIQLAKDAGATVIATTRTSEKKDFLQGVGADHVVATTEENLAERVADFTGGSGCRLIYDPIGGPFIETLGNCVAVGGIILVYGIQSGEMTPVPVSGFLKAVKIMPYAMPTIFMNPVTRGQAMAYINERLAADAFRPVIDKTFKLDDVVEAFKYLAGNSLRGKVVLET